LFTVVDLPICAYPAVPELANAEPSVLVALRVAAKVVMESSENVSFCTVERGEFA
jgi:hypothetical protein